MLRSPRHLSAWRLAVLVGLLSLTVSESAWAGAWTVPKGRWYTEYFYRYFGSKRTFDPDGESMRRPTHGNFRDIRNELKLEYGITDWLNLLASAPYISSHYVDDNVDLLRTGVGDIWLRSKLRFLNYPLGQRNSPLVGSGQVGWKIPSAYHANENPLGDGQVDFESRLLFSYAWPLSPYEVKRPIETPSRTPPTAAEREAAIRDAVMIAELYQRGAALIEQGDFEQAGSYLQATLQADPSHYDAMLLVLTHARALAEAGTGEYFPPYETVELERFEPLPVEDAPEFEMEMRYARMAFVNLESGFTMRNEDPANEVPLVLEAGFAPLKRLMLVGSIDSVFSIKSTDEETEDYAKWGLRAIVNIWGDGFANIFRRGGPTVNFETGYNNIFAGRNTADAFEVFGKIGIFF